MEHFDAIVVGGGPAGSTCAWKLRQAGLDVVVLDKAVFPRDKVCAGWITPKVVRDLELDLDHYGRRLTLQPITAFRTGVIGRRYEVDTSYARPVSYGIRRCEFDDYLLRRSGARLRLGSAASSIRRERERWIVGDAIAAPVVVGAGGHFCPVARALNPRTDGAPVVIAREAEVPIDDWDDVSLSVRGEAPELYFCDDLKGYGWCFRKQGYLNVGLGRLDPHGTPAAADAFVAFLKAQRRIPSDAAWRWRGHAYLVSEPRVRDVVGEGVLLAGDAAGLAYPQSGEGIGPAIESGLIAASTIVEADGIYSRERLQPYEDRLRARYGFSAGSRALSDRIPPRLASALARSLMRVPLFVRHVVLDRWFLRSPVEASL
jgi:geranylgeranyl reductase family protein